MLHGIFSYVAFLFVVMQLCFCLTSPIYIPPRTVTSLPQLPWVIQHFKQMWQIVDMRN